MVVVLMAVVVAVLADVVVVGGVALSGSDIGCRQ